MARIVNTLLGRLVLLALLIHAVLLPALFFGLSHIIERSHEDMFLDQVRIYSRFVADMFERGLQASEDATELLDSVVLSGEVVYAELRSETTRLSSSLLEDTDHIAYMEDFEFGEHGDGIYYLSVPVAVAEPAWVLRLGFDEQPAFASISEARRRMLSVLVIYLGISVAAVVLLSIRLSQPLSELQLASRKIASGHHSERLAVHSRIVEISELAKDLEFMRSELVGLNSRLQKEIAERRSAEAQLRHAQKLETVGTLAGGIAHEFNNILVPILLYTDIALEDLASDDPIRHDLERVMRAAKRARGLVQQILTFSRQVGHEQQVPVKLDTIVDEALTMLRALVPATIEIRQHLDNEDTMVLADPTQMHQLVVNLCNNACQAMQKTGGTLEVTLDKLNLDESFVTKHTGLRSGPYVHLSVSDTGHGIDAATLERIFEPFFSTREVGEGTGLGLSVVHGIAVSHGGDIVAESEVGRGTTFHVYLPELETSPVESTERKTQILYVDDEEDVMRASAKVLDRLNCETTAISDPMSALALFEADPCRFDIVITNQSMPKMTGCELAKYMVHLRPDLPIILISGFGDVVTSREREKLGIHEYLVKPVEARVLRAAVRRILMVERRKEVEL